LLLLLLQAAFPDGVPTDEIARLLYPGFDQRTAKDRIRDLARTLRKWGYHAHGVRGIYYLCNDNPEKFTLASRFREPLAAGDIVSFIRMLLEARKADAAGEYREALREMAASTATLLRDLASRLEAAFA
jgi:hypothetical protein